MLLEIVEEKLVEMSLDEIFLQEIVSAGGR